MTKIAVASGKGGVGKSTIAISLAHALSKRGFKTAVLDADVTGSNVPDILGYSEIRVENDMLIPSECMEIKYVSIGQIASKDLPILWSGRDIGSAAKQLLERTEWGEPDYLIIDLPPGSEEENQKLIPLCDFVVFVTIPSVLSESKVRRMIELAREAGTPILGLVKNFSRFICPKCGESHYIFPEEHSFEEYGLPVLAEIPISPEIAEKKIINEFNVEPFLEAMKHPIVLPKRKLGLKARLIRALLRVGG